MSDYTTGVIADWAREVPELDTSSIEVINRIVRAGQILQVKMDAVAAAHGLSHKGDLDVLTALRRMGPPYEQTPSRLAKAVQLTSGGMTNRLDRLEAAGLVARRPDPQDRRGVLVGLSDRGQELVAGALREVLREQQRLLESLTGSERISLSSAMRTLLVNLGDDRDQQLAGEGVA